MEKWSAIIQIAEDSDNELAARAWFSIGYSILDENVTKIISSYDRAIQSKPDFFRAYVNRGNLKGILGRDEDAIADLDKAIQLKPDMAEP